MLSVSHTGIERRLPHLSHLSLFNNGTFLFHPVSFNHATIWFYLLLYLYTSYNVCVETEYAWLLVFYAKYKFRHFVYFSSLLLTLLLHGFGS